MVRPRPLQRPSSAPRWLDARGIAGTALLAADPVLKICRRRQGQPPLTKR
jgi:hypothetical protein